MKTLLASVAAMTLMGGAAFAQSVVLVPEGGSPAGARFMLVPVPQENADSGASGQQAARDRAEAMALDFYNRGYRRGVADARSAAGPALDPAAMKQLGRELFERGYMLGLMQARAQITMNQMPEFEGEKPEFEGQKQASETGTDQQAGAGGGEQESAAMAGDGAADAAGKAAQQEVALASQEDPAAEGTATEGAQIAIGSRDTEKYGMFLADDTGRPVYMFTTDEQGAGEEAMAQSSCSDKCAEVWPPVTTSAKPLAEDAANETLISTFEREDGVMQVTYNGWPLYYFAKDKGSEAPTGQDVHGFGGEWYLLQPNGETVGQE